MAYHGNCCVCALTLCLCVFGSMSTSTGICLLLSYKKFGGISTPERALPLGDWTKVTGIVICSIGGVMFISGILLAVCCLTAGVALKSQDKYKVFHNDPEDQTEKKQESKKCQTERNPSAKSSGTGDVKSVSFVDCAYDVAFIEKENTGANAATQHPSRKRNDGEENSAIECVSEQEAYTDSDVEPRIEYPSVNLEASETYPDVHCYNTDII